MPSFRSWTSLTHMDADHLEPGAYYVMRIDSSQYEVVRWHGSDMAFFWAGSCEFERVEWDFDMERWRLPRELRGALIEIKAL